MRLSFFGLLIGLPLLAHAGGQLVDPSAGAGESAAGSAPDRRAAARRAERGCREAEPGACATAARARLEGWSGAVDLPGAAALAAPLCPEDPASCGVAALALVPRGRNAELRAEALELARLGCGDGSGDPDACAAWAQIVLLERRDPEAASEALFAAALACDAAVERGLACLVLGDAYYVGQGVPRFREEAKLLYWMACERGLAKGCRRAGKLLAGGQGAEASLPHADQALSRGCALGDPPACLLRGELRTRGPEELRDPSAGLGAFGQACALGLAQGCVEAARARVALGERGPAHAARAERAACREGYGPACADVAAGHTGAAAARWTARACAAGFDPACPPGEAPALPPAPDAAGDGADPGGGGPPVSAPEQVAAPSPATP